MSITRPTKKEFTNRVVHLNILCRNTKAALETGQIMGMDASSKHPYSEEGAGYLVVLLDSLRRNSYITTSTLYNPNSKREVSIAIIQEVLQEPSCNNLFQKDVTPLQIMMAEFLDDNKDLIGRIKKWRNKYYAHHDLQYFTNNAALEKVNPQEHIELLNFAMYYFNSILEYMYGDERYSLQPHKIVEFVPLIQKTVDIARLEQED